jgi:hypothetical protein
MTSAEGELFLFLMTDYNAELVTDITGCSTDTCLDVTGNGLFTGSGPITYSASPVSFTFTSQEAPGQTSTTFSASAAASPVAEPASLALFGSGLLGVLELARRKLRV